MVMSLVVSMMMTTMLMMRYCDLRVLRIRLIIHCMSLICRLMNTMIAMSMIGPFGGCDYDDDLL